MKSSPNATPSPARTPARKRASVRAADIDTTAEEGASPALRAQAYDRFTAKVLAGELRPGQFVSQRELVKLLDIPLGAVREMIPRLEGARLIVTVPKRGLQIAQVDLKLIRNAFHIRSMIEREAVAHFVQSASDEEIAAIEQAHRAVLERARSGRKDARLAADAQAVDWGLHDRMVDAMGNEILSEIYRVNSLHVRMIRLDAHLVRPHRILPAMEEHLAFIERLKVRDVEGAVREMARHIDSSRQRVLAALLGE